MSNDRKTTILETGAKLAAKHGAVNVTRRMVAKAAKLPESVVSYYMGGADDAQRAYTKQAKKLGLTLPTKQEAEAIGVKLRAHKPRDARDTRRRSVKEVEAIKRKKGNQTMLPEKVIGKAAVKALRAQAAVETKPTAPPSTKPVALPKIKAPGPASAPAQSPPSTKTAARLPKAPPTLPALPTASSTGVDDGIGSGSPSPAS